MGKFASAFRAKVAIGAIKEEETTAIYLQKGALCAYAAIEMYSRFVVGRRLMCMVGSS